MGLAVGGEQVNGSQAGKGCSIRHGVCEVGFFFGFFLCLFGWLVLFAKYEFLHGTRIPTNPPHFLPA